MCFDFIANFLFVGNEMFDGLLVSDLNVICQICHSLDGNATVFSIHYQRRSYNAIPAMPTFAVVCPSETLWYPNSTEMSHMTPDILPQICYHVIDYCLDNRWWPLVF